MESTKKPDIFGEEDTGHRPGNDLLSQGLSPHYHRRNSVSLPGSGWDRVVPLCCGHQNTKEVCSDRWSVCYFVRLLMTNSLVFALSGWVLSGLGKDRKVVLCVKHSLTSVERYFVLCKLTNKRNILFGFVFVLGFISSLCEWWVTRYFIWLLPYQTCSFYSAYCCE